MKQLMVLGAGRGQVELIKAIKRYGHKAIVASIEGDYPGFLYADQVVNIDISDKYAVSEAARTLQVDGIVTACLNTGVSALGYACEENNLCGLSSEAAEVCGDKLKMKTAFEKYGVSTARFRSVFREQDIETSARELDFPLILKAVDLQGSRGIYVCENKERLYDSYKLLKGETSKEYCIVEEFINGYEISAEAFVAQGEILYILPCGDVTIKSESAFVPGGHYVPCDIDDKIREQVIVQAEKAIRTIGLDNCDVNFDLIVKDDKVFIIELTGRLGANCLPELVSSYYGIDIYKLIIDTALGENPKKYFKSCISEPVACYAQMLTSDKSGTLKEIINNNEDSRNIIDITFFVSPCDEVRKFTNSRDCVGQVIVKGNTLEECRNFIKEVISKIEFVVE